MGVKGLTAFIKRNKRKYYTLQNTEVEPIRLAVDGFSLLYDFTPVFTERGIEKMFSYFEIHKFIFYFCDYLRARGMEIAYMCMDDLIDPLKIDCINDRSSKSCSEMIDYVESNFKDRLDGRVFTLTNYMIYKSISDYYNDRVRFVFCGLDPDREIAHISIKHNCYVLTNDSDFFVYDTPGVVDLESLLDDFYLIKKYNKVLPPLEKLVCVYHQQRFLGIHHISYNEFVCSCIIKGNDFVKGIQSDEFTHDFTSVMAFVKKQKLFSVDEFASFYHSLNEEVSEQDYLVLEEKYNIDNYPDYPYSYVITNRQKVKEWKDIDFSCLGVYSYTTGLFYHSFFPSVVHIDPFIDSLTEEGYYAKYPVLYFEYFFADKMDIYRAKHGDPSRHVPRKTSNDSNDSNDTNSKEIGPSFADSFTRESVKKRIRLCLYYRSLSLREKCDVISSLLEIPNCLFDDCDEKDVYTIGVLGLLKEMRFKNWRKEKWDYYYSFVITSMFFHGHLEHTRSKFTDDDRKCFFFVSYVMSECTKAMATLVTYFNINSPKETIIRYDMNKVKYLYYCHLNKGNCPHCGLLSNSIVRRCMDL